jgi:predicted nucleic acid-binding protein
MSARWVVDTDVISELAKPSPTPRVIGWLEREGEIALASVTVFELAQGIERKPAGRKRAFLEGWFSALLARR